MERTEAHARGDHCATMFAATVSGLGLFGCWCAFGFAMTGLYYLVGGGADFADDDDMDDQVRGIEQMRTYLKCAHCRLYTDDYV